MQEHVSLQAAARGALRKREKHRRGSTRTEEQDLPHLPQPSYEASDETQRPPPPSITVVDRSWNSVPARALPCAHGASARPPGPAPGATRAPPAAGPRARDRADPGETLWRLGAAGSTRSC
ncbi:unnamed protein product [Prorocentrum cordatum]|uniref:Uncharacterized protein n=1 Tax=Prorocentrum cordatum TaxID=2364126 RepID=A0ABN9QDQ2_9DINO|nr:unnamed protein product [Polarella glacialis]